MHPATRGEMLDHLGLVAGMCDELGRGDIMDRATQQNPEPRIVTLGNAVKVEGLNGLGCVNQPLSLVPMFFQHKPPPRRVAPGLDAAHRKDDTLGHALDTLDDDGVTALYALMATTAAPRLG